MFQYGYFPKLNIRLINGTSSLSSYQAHTQSGKSSDLRRHPTSILSSPHPFGVSGTLCLFQNFRFLTQFNMNVGIMGDRHSLTWDS